MQPPDAALHHPLREPCKGAERARHAQDEDGTDGDVWEEVDHNGNIIAHLRDRLEINRPRKVTIESDNQPEELSPDFARGNPVFTGFLCICPRWRPRKGDN